MDDSPILVGIDVGKSHEVAMKGPDGDIQSWSLTHRQQDFDAFKQRLKTAAEGDLSRVVVGIEGHNGHLLPLDHYLKQWGCELRNVDAKRLAHFRSMYGASAKTDVKDARLIVHLLSQSTALFQDGNAPYVPVHRPDPARRKLKKLTRHQKAMVEAKTRAVNRLKQLLREHCPDLLDVMSLKSTRFLRALNRHPRIRGLKRTTVDGFQAIEGIGPKTARQLKQQTQNLDYDREMDSVNGTLIEDLTSEILRYQRRIGEIDDRLESLGESIPAVQWVRSFPGAGVKIASRLVGEIQSIKRFDSQDALAAYLGVACTDDQSGKSNQASPVYPCNTMGKSAIMDLAHKMSYLDPESQSYYQKKLDEGKAKMDAKRRVARQIVKILYRMLVEERKYRQPDEVQSLQQAA